MLYAANSLSLCALEILVHVGGKRLVPDKYSWVAIDVPGDLIEKLAETVPEDKETSQRMGADWIRSGKQPVAEVPSVILPNDPQLIFERNYLFNRNHHQFRRLLFSEPQPFIFDARLEIAVSGAAARQNPKF